MKTLKFITYDSFNLSYGVSGRVRLHCIAWRHVPGRAYILCVQNETYDDVVWCIWGKHCPQGLNHWVFDFNSFWSSHIQKPFSVAKVFMSPTFSTVISIGCHDLQIERARACFILYLKDPVQRAKLVELVLNDVAFPLTLFPFQLTFPLCSARLRDGDFWFPPNHSSCPVLAHSTSDDPTPLPSTCSFP